MEDQFEICHYCQEPTKTPTRDHVYPKAKIRNHNEKGETLPEGVDLHDNKVIACVACNTLKGTKDYESFKLLGLKAIRHLKRQFINKSIKKHARKGSRRRKYTR